MKLRKLHSLSFVLALLVALCIVPSYAFALDNVTAANQVNQTPELKYCPGPGFLRNIAGENYTDVKASILDSISKRITELQSLYTEVNKTSNVSELKAVLINHRQANDCTGLERMGKRADRMFISCNGVNGFFLSQVENVTDENFTAVQADLLSSLQNTTAMLKNQQDRLAEVQQDNRTQALNESLNDRIIKLQDLTSEVSKASTAAELKQVVFRYLQTQAVDLIDREIEQLKADSGEHSTRITELTTLKDSINGAKSLDDLKQVMYSSCSIPGFKENMSHHRGHGRCGC